MQTQGVTHTSIWHDADKKITSIIDQTELPHSFTIVELKTFDDFVTAINEMWVRGAPLIGITAAFAMARAMAEDPSECNERNAAARLIATRPTAINLQWAVDKVRQHIHKVPAEKKASTATQCALALRQQDIFVCEAIGQHGLKLLHELQPHKISNGETLNILTHCNAGWLATVDWGTALAPIYKAHNAGLKVHVWVDETRPRNQGASLTAWELEQHGVPHTIITDNTGGHLMQKGMVDLCLVGSDRTAANGDVCNKIGTYLKALAAHDNQIPFYAALPSSTIDWDIADGVGSIPIEERDSREITHMSGLDKHGNTVEIQLTGTSSAANYAFDVTPARLVSGLITEHGLISADTYGLNQLKQLLKVP